MTDQVRGIVLPSPTVFLEDGTVDEKLMRELTDWFIACGVHAFFILGSYGQGPALPPEERKKVAEIVVQQVKHRVPVVVHIGAVDPYTAIDLGKHAKAIGAEAIGHVGPYYYADRSEYEIIEHFKMVDRAVGMPILVYNNPRYSGYNIHPDFMARLVSAVPRIFGAKLAMGSVDEAMAYMKIVKAPFAPVCVGKQSRLCHVRRRRRHDQPAARRHAGDRCGASPRHRCRRESQSIRVAKDGHQNPRYFPTLGRSLRPDDLLRSHAAARVRRENVSALAVQAAQPRGLRRIARTLCRTEFAQLGRQGEERLRQLYFPKGIQRRMKVVFTIVLSAMVWLGTALHTPAQERVRLALSVRNVVFLPFYYAKDSRIFEKHGLNVELIQMRSDLQVVGLVSGEIDYIPVDRPGDFSGRQRRTAQGAGGSLQSAAFSRSRRRRAWALSKNLEGKKVAVSRIGSDSHRYGSMLIESGGADPKKVTFLQTGSTTISLSSLQQGVVNGAVLSPPFTGIVAEKGFKILARSRQLVDSPWLGLVVNKQKLEKQPEQVRNMLRSMRDVVGRDPPRQAGGHFLHRKKLQRQHGECGRILRRYQRRDHRFDDHARRADPKIFGRVRINAANCPSRSPLRRCSTSLCCEA